MDEYERAHQYQKLIDSILASNAASLEADLENGSLPDRSLIEGLSALDFSIEADFLADLRKQLLETHGASGREPLQVSREKSFAGKAISRAMSTLRLHPVRYALLAMLVLLIAGFYRPLAAQLQRILIFAPHAGFIEPQELRAIASPVVARKGDVSVIVDQALATSEKTIVVFHTLGLDTDARTSSIEAGQFKPSLRSLSTGVSFPLLMKTVDFGSARLEFGPIPADMHEIELRFNQLPLAADGMAPEHWVIRIPLVAVEGDRLAMLPEPYTPEHASMIQDGIGFVIDRVAHTDDEIAIQYSILWKDEKWTPVGFVGLRLLEGNGRSLWPRHDAISLTPRGGVIEVESTENGKDVTSHMWTSLVGFPPVEDDPGVYSMVADGIVFSIPVDKGFVIDLGEKPAIGSTYPLDIDLRIEGIRVHFSEATILPEDENGLPLRLELAVYGIPQAPGRRIEELTLSAPFPFTSSNAGWNGDQLKAYIALDPGHGVPSGEIPLRVSEAFVNILGPWQVSWARPSE